jgi:Tfp pilus assembly protein PilE
MKNLMIKKKQAGMTSFELLIAVVVLALLAAGVYAIFNTFMAGNRVQNAGQEMMQINSGTASLYRSSGSFSGINVSTLVANKIPPRKMVVGTNRIVDAWGRDLAVTAVNSNESAAFTHAGVDVNDCSAYVRTVEGGFHTITVNGKTVKNLKTGSPGPLNVAQLGVACSARNDSVAVVLTMSRQ